MESRLQEGFRIFTSIGMDENGAVNRVIGTKEYWEAAAVMKKYLSDLGMESYMDSVGNVHGIYHCAGKENPEKPVRLFRL